jgi:hypothetical protein
MPILLNFSTLTVHVKYLSALVHIDVLPTLEGYGYIHYLNCNWSHRYIHMSRPKLYTLNICGL